MQCFLENCLAKNIESKVDQSETMKEIWRNLDATFSEPFKFERDIMKYMLPFTALQDSDHEGVAVYCTRLLSLIKESDRAGMSREVVHPNNVDLLTQKLSSHERGQWAEYLHFYSSEYPKETLCKNFVNHCIDYAQAQQLAAGDVETRSF